jgi:DNA-binding transcriptional ArsR family regulator
MLTREFVLAPQVVRVEFAIAPVISVLNSLMMTREVQRLSGLGAWVEQVAAGMSESDRWMAAFLSDSLALSASDALANEAYTDFPAFLHDLSAADPVQLRDRMFDYVLRLPEIYPVCWPSDAAVPTAREALADARTYIAFMASFKDMNAQGESFWAESYALISQPKRMQREIVAFLTRMWDNAGLRDEWARALPILQESVSAYQKQNYHHLTALEAIRAVTGRDLSGKFDDPEIARAERIVFVPSLHMGPYISGMLRDGAFYVIFGARSPRGVQTASPDLSRADLLIRLGALADDTRLHILELLTQHDELCAQDIIESLGISQSSASRHLSQLSASGFVTERRRELNKCYSLNPERVTDLLRALRSFLTRQ